MKKNLFLIIGIVVLLFAGLAYTGPNSAIGVADPFAEPPKREIGRTEDRNSDKALSDKLLKAFEEERLDKGTGKDRPLIRIS